MTVADAIAKALRLCGVLDHHADPDSKQLANGLVSLNGLIGQLGAYKNAVYAPTDVSKLLTSGTASYTIGSGGDIDTTRPNRIITAYVRQSNIDYNIAVIDEGKYDSKSFKSSTGIPEELYHKKDYPLGTITLYPVPDAADYTLYLKLWAPLSTYSTVGDSLALPPEYEDMICYNLAIRIQGEYPGTILQQSVVAVAGTSLRIIKDLNSQPVRQIATDPFRANRRSNIFGDQ